MCHATYCKRRNSARCTPGPRTRTDPVMAHLNDAREPPISPKPCGKG